MKTALVVHGAIASIIPRAGPPSRRA